MSDRIEIDLDKIERVAKAAPHEEWIAIDGGFGDSEVLITTESRHASGRVAICEMDVDYSGTIGDEQRASRDFIIASNPAVVLELVRRLREAEKDAARWRAARSLEHCNAVWCAIGAGDAGKNLDAAIDEAMGEPK